MSDIGMCEICGGCYPNELLCHLQIQAYKIRRKEDSEMTEQDTAHLEFYLMLRTRRAAVKGRKTGNY